MAVTVMGSCMEPLLYEGDMVLCEQVRRPEQVPSGTLCVVWVMDDEDPGGNVRYVEWAGEVARLWGEDGTRRLVPKHRLHVRGRVIEMRRRS